MDIHTHFFQMQKYSNYTAIQPSHYCGVPAVKLQCPEMGGSHPFISQMPENSTQQNYELCSIT